MSVPTGDVSFPILASTPPPPPQCRMSSGEGPIGAAKGKQSDTEALCQTPPKYTGPFGVQWPAGGGGCAFPSVVVKGVIRQSQGAWRWQLGSSSWDRCLLLSVPPAGHLRVSLNGTSGLVGL